MKKIIKTIPKFKNEDEERDFWDTHDVTDYFDMSKAIKNVSFPNLKPTTRSISLRLNIGMLDKIKVISNKKDVPYQSYIKIILDREIQKEMRKA